MLKDILQLKGVSQLQKKAQKTIKGGLFFGDCPNFCQTADDCLSNPDCSFSQAICAGGTCLFFG
ncbi:hypothetical protein [Spongiimicrobium salis]|uniref:hypothetical protein n=1 Tax=Spongiimicrobium salis TaxID=1667022 RepID=UPI00374CADE0